MRVLLAYDGSEGAGAVLRELPLAGLPPESELLLLSIVDAWLPPDGQIGSKADAVLPRLPEVRARVRASVEREREKVERVAEALRREFPRWRISATAIADSPAWAIVKRAEGLEGGVGGLCADLVIVGSRGLGGLKRVLLGSVSRRVLAEARCSVRIARTPVERAAVATPPKLMIGIDGSVDSGEAVRAVAFRRWPEGTSILIAACDEFASGAGQRTWRTFDPIRDAKRLAARSWSGHYVSEAVEILRECKGVALSAALKAGDPKRGLVELARGFDRTGVDCVFLGARGLRGIERFLVGSVSNSVATNAHCSVEIVRPPRPPGAS